MQFQLRLPTATFTGRYLQYGCGGFCGVISAAPFPDCGGLHNAVVATCDGMDGLVDDQIDDPRDCRFDPVALQCPTGTDQPSCLTPAQVDAARMLYAGPTDAHGRRLYPGGQTRGSELSWDSYHWLILPAGERRLGRETACRHLPEIRQISPRYAHSSVADFEFTEAYSQPD